MNVTTTFEQAVVAMKAVIGSEHVLLDSAMMAQHSRDTSTHQRTCSAVVYPGSRDEVCALVRIAGQHGLKVWTFSKGRNWGYGAHMAAEDGVVIIILERMNRILEVNRELAYAVIEPGVTYKQLADHLKSHATGLWADCTDSTPEGSVIGNALDRGLGHTPYGDHFGNLCGLEVVLANGDVIQTGGGPPEAPAWHTFKWGSGPYIEGLFSQSNFGIVTRAGIWLMPEPQAYLAFFCEIEDEQSLPEVADSMRKLAFAGALRGTAHLINDVLYMAMVMPYPHEACGSRTYLSDEALRGLRRRHGFTPWTLTSGLYGTPAQIRANRRLIQQELRRFGKLTFVSRGDMRILERLSGFVKRTESVSFVRGLGRIVRHWLIGRAPTEVFSLIPNAVSILQGVPSEFIVRFAYFKSREGRPLTDVDPVRDGCGLIWFAPIVPLNGSHVNRLFEICRPAFHEHGFDFSVSLILVNPRSAVALMEIFYDKDDAAETARAKLLYEHLCGLTFSAGYQHYRANVAAMNRLQDSVPEYKKFLGSIKRAVDPNNTLAPGRYGMGL